jgi:hypothetical protein
MKPKPAILDNFLNENDLNFVQCYFDGPIWEFGEKSLIGKPSVHKWFRAHLRDEPFFNGYLKSKIEKICGCNFIVDNVYANGHTFMSDGSWHRDNEAPGYITALLYVSDINHENVGDIHGHTDFKLENNEIISIEPIKNRLVLFDSRVLHRGNGPTIPGFLRIAVAWKLKKIT